MCWAYNSSNQSTIRTTRFQLLYGFPADTPGLQNKVLLEDKPTFEAHSSRLAIIAEERCKATVHSEQQKAQQKRAFNKRPEVQRFSLNQQVLVRVHDFLKQKWHTGYKI